MTDTKPTRLLPPTHLLAAIVLMIVAHQFAPVWQLWRRPWTHLGGVPILLGFGLVMYCARVHWRRRTTIKPFERPTVLITDGPHRFSRNPIYVGLVLVLLGVAILLGSATPWLVVPFFVWTITVQFIEHEEASLAERFGDEYAEYRRRVGRWF